MGMVRGLGSALCTCRCLGIRSRVHDYIVAEKEREAALDALVKDWIKVFKQEGKIIVVIVGA